MLARITDQRAETVRDALVERVSTLPEHLWRSLTWDQGREMARHQEFSEITGIDVYFYDPHSPWQRGSKRTPTACSANGCPKAPTCPSSLKTISTTSP